MTIKSKRVLDPSEYSCSIGLNRKSKPISKVHTIKNFPLKCLPSTLDKGISLKKKGGRLIKPTKIFSVVEESNLQYQDQLNQLIEVKIYQYITVL